ncbi:MAG: hypothetical protein HQK89_03110 [Nitrospirae bacterium]|nr:hypothetical protein [Nitrospirota bacterium]
MKGYWKLLVVKGVGEGSSQKKKHSYDNATGKVISEATNPSNRVRT